MTQLLDRAADRLDDARIGMVIELMATLSRAQDPRETLTLFFDTMRKMWGVRGHLAIDCDGADGEGYRILCHQGPDGRDLVPMADLWEGDQMAARWRGGWLGEVCRAGVPRLIRDLQVSNDPVLGDAMAVYRAAVIAPIFEQGTIRRWAILFGEVPEAFDERVLEQFVLRANLIGLAIQNLRNLQLLRQTQAKMQREVERIAEIQKALLPETLPSIPGLRIAASYETFDRAGGDIYTFYNLSASGVPRDAPTDPDGGWAIFIGDVSGHGPAAAVVMAMVHAILDAYPRRPERPSEVLHHVNRHLLAKKIDASFVTGFLAFYDPGTRQLTYSAAGHPPPLWRYRDEQGTLSIRLLDGVTGFPLGVVPDAQYEDATVTLSSGQTLAFYTDGITEARGADGAFFGTEGVETALLHCSGEATCLVDTLRRELKAFERGGRPQDDQTVVAVEVV